MRTIIATILLLLATPASAEWSVRTWRDKMTDRETSAATVSNSGATLYVGCKNGQVFPEVGMPAPRYVRVGASYRLDNGPVVPRIAPTSRDGRSLWLWLGDPAGGAAALAKAKRLRVSVEGDVWDFDLTGGAAAIGRVKC